MSISQGLYRYPQVLRVDDLRGAINSLPADAKVFFKDEDGKEVELDTVYIDGNGEVLLS